MNNFPPEIKTYTPISFCGKGGYGKVWRVKDAFGIQYALKVIDKNEIGDSWEREFKGVKEYKNKICRFSIYKNLIHIEHVGNFVDFFYYVMDIADNLGDEENYIPDTLMERIKRKGRLTQDEVVVIFDQLLDGLQILHSAGLVHRDIKPDNIIFVNGVPKLSDMGLVSSNAHTVSLVTTPLFIPPEILTGRKKSFDQYCDIYALGKTLFCAFSGQSVERFPFISPSVLSNRRGRLINELIQQSCATDTITRIKTIDHFRKALHGDIGWWYEFKRVIKKAIKILFSTISIIALGIRYLLANKWILILLFSMLIMWFNMVLQTYWQLEKELYPYDYGFHPLALKRAFTEWHVQFGNYDMYDMQKKTQYSIKAHGERYRVPKKKYLRAKHTYIPQNIGFGFEVGDGPASVKGTSQITVEEPNLTQSTPLREEYLHELFYQGNYSQKLDVPAGTEWRDHVMLLPAVKKGTMRFVPELPLTSELNLDFNPADFKGTLAFILTAAEYIPLPNQPLPEIQLKRQLRFQIVSDGKKLIFEEAVYRHQDKDEDNLMNFGRPKIKSVPLQDKFYRLTIISADHVRRVYLDGNLIWGTHLAFFGGHFEMKYSCKTSQPLRIGDFSVYDAKIVQPDEKRKSRLKLPVSLSLLKAAKPTAESVKRTEISKPKEVITPVIVPPKTTTFIAKPAIAKTETIPVTNEPVSTKNVSTSTGVPVAEAPKKPASQKSPPSEFIPVRKSSKDLSRKDYKSVQEDIVERLGRRKKLENILPGYNDIPAADVVIDAYYEHEKGGTVYEYRIPSKQIRGNIRIQYAGYFTYKGLDDFFLKDKRIELYE